MNTEQRKVMEEYGYKETAGTKWGEFTKGLQKQPKMTYYKPDGEPLPNLPADPLFMRRYLDRGFTLTPPVGKVWPPPSAEEATEASEFTCSVCGKACKSRLGLISHSKTHKS